jgi:hypothetical protein
MKPICGVLLIDGTLCWKPANPERCAWHMEDWARRDPLGRFYPDPMQIFDKNPHNQHTHISQFFTENFTDFTDLIKKVTIV